MSTILAIVIALVQLIFGLLIAFLAVNWSIKLFNTTFRKVALLDEIRAGNVAAGILASGIVLAVAVIIQVGVAGITKALSPDLDISGMLLALLAGVGQLLLGILLSVLAIRLALSLFNSIFRGFDLQEQIKNGNVAVALIAALVLVAFASIIQASIAGIAASVGVILPTTGVNIAP